jgi:hypothetical protein
MFAHFAVLSSLGSAIPALHTPSNACREIQSPGLGRFPMDNDAHAAEESRRLLLDVLPLFTSTPDRVDSTKHACFQAYHILICAEAKILEGLLNHCDIRAPQYADILGKVLKLFESLVKPDIISPSTSFLVCILIYSCNPQTVYIRLADC